MITSLSTEQAQQINIAKLIHKVFDQVDSRLAGHGMRVAYMLRAMLHAKGGYTESEIRKLCFVGLLHDIGVIETGDFEQLLDFENDPSRAHSIFGYQCIRYFSPLSEYAHIVLYHHCDYKDRDYFLKRFPGTEDLFEIGNMINLVDHIDISELKTEADLNRYLYSDSTHSRINPLTIELFATANREYNLFQKVRLSDCMNDMLEYFGKANLTPPQVEQIYNMLVGAIEARCESTVSHSHTVEVLAITLAYKMELHEDSIRHIRVGALLHDVGKIAVAPCILDKPGRLDCEEWNQIRGHVQASQDILEDFVSTSAMGIALRHHERLDGSGYPHAIEGKDLSIEERIVAVADIISALLGHRSYKPELEKDHILEIVYNDADRGLIDMEVVKIVEEHWEELVNLAGVCSKIQHEEFQEIACEHATLVELFAKGA